MLPLARLDRHPVDIRKIAFKLRVVPALAGDGVVVVIVPIAVLRSSEPVLPHAVRAFANPCLTDHTAFGIVEGDAHEVDDTIETVVYIHGHGAVLKERIVDRRDGAVGVARRQRVAVPAKLLQCPVIII